MFGKKTAHSLTFRLIALLTITILPLGLITIYQTSRVVSEATSVFRSDKLARTVDVANSQVSLIMEAQGAANGLGVAVARIGPTDELCSSVMHQFVNDHPSYVFAGFIETGGMMRCVSGGEPYDFSEFPSWATFVANPKPTVAFNPSGTSTGLSVLIVSTPVFDQNGEFLGATSISIPHSLLDDNAKPKIEGVEVAIVNEDGLVMSESGEALGQRLRGIQDFALVDLEIPRSGKIVELNTDTTLSVVPIEPFNIYVVGAWSDVLSLSPVGAATPLFPVAMWLTSLIVGVFAIQSLVLRHLQKLRTGMRRVSLDNVEASYVQLQHAPNELSEIGDSYNALLSRVSDDATALAEAAVEKELLLKEVHHRVKNNLQLISSILNMQLRQISSPDARSVLRRVQKRVMSLAAVHKLLYTDTKIDLVRVDLLLADIVSNTVKMGDEDEEFVRTETSFEAIELEPDRAVPLALLVTEAVTNALKYSGTSGGTLGEIRVSLVSASKTHFLLKVANSLKRATRDADKEEGTGLGSKLISAFVTQLDGQSQVKRNDETYEITVEFPK